MCNANGKNRCPARCSTSGRYTSWRCCWKTWSKFPTGWWKCTPNTNRTGSMSGGHASQIQLPSRAHRRIVAGCQGESLQQTRFEAGGVRARELDRPRGGAQHDQRLEPGDVIEEPAAGGEHAQCVALELEQLTCPRERAPIVRATQPLADEARDGVVRRSQDGAVDVPNRPWVRGEDGAPLPLEHPVQLGRQPIERVPQRGAPALMRRAIPVHSTAAVR